MVVYAQWFAPVGYVWNNYRIKGHYSEPYWYNDTGRDITFKYIVKNSMWDEEDSMASATALVINTKASASGGTWIFEVASDSLNWKTVSGTFTLPSGKYLVIYNCNNADGLITVWEE